VSAGKLDRRITIQRRTTTLDSYGQQSSGWTNIATVWANVKPVGGREKLRSGALESTLTHTVMLRYQIDLMPAIEADAWRILYGTRVLQITAAMDKEDARRWIIFDCIETGAE
jgi:SPP1 family predicted phage head-tail adaptor